MAQESRRVVVTGLGALTPIGNNVSTFWDSLKQGVSGADHITYFDTDKFKTKFACELKGFDPTDYLDRKEVRIHDPYLHYALVSTEEAVRDAGINFDKLDLYRSGVIWGTGNGGIQSFHHDVVNFEKGGGSPRYNPYFMPKILVNMASGVIAIKYDMKGISFSPITACASSNTAIIEAFHHIKWGNADLIIAGGSDAAINESGIGGFNAIRALSTLNDNPKMASRPFDLNRDGFVMGEGSGTLIIEEMNHALDRGAKIYAEIGGGAMTSDAYHLTATHPDGEGALRAMKMTMENSGVVPNDLDYVNTHATSTPLGDISELKALEKIFTDRSPTISSTKSMTGHLLGAAGAIEAVASLKALENNIVPATINTTEFDKDCPPHLQIVTGNAIEQEINVVMSNTFGFGGHNAIILFKTFEN